MSTARGRPADACSGKCSRPGPEELFTAVMEAHWNWVHALARRRLRDVCLADDAAQAVFLLAWQRLSLGELDDAALGAWLRRSTEYVCGNLLRSERRMVAKLRLAAAELASRNRCTEPGAPSLCGELSSALSRLPGEDREIITARFLQREKLAQIAQRMGIAPRSAQLRIRRALARLRCSLEGEDRRPAAFWLVPLSGLVLIQPPAARRHVGPYLGRAPAPGRPALSRAQGIGRLGAPDVLVWLLLLVIAGTALAGQLAHQRACELSAPARRVCDSGKGMNAVGPLGRRVPPPKGEVWVPARVVTAEWGAFPRDLDALAAPNPVPRRERFAAPPDCP